ncbi:MAG TPA: Crp/Fnr family transcriptional regulator [Burkholderiales bacterium]|nr:Crp/Fnr family transcriptional regulator [Burkholderiales bacterium]
MGEPDWEALVGVHGELAAVPAALRGSAGGLAAKAGETLFRTATRPTKIFWVVDGEVRLVRRSRNGAEIVLQRASAGFVAEASLDSPAYHCDAVAAQDSRLLAFPINRFREALAEDEKFRAFWMRRLAREVRTLRSQSERLALHSAAERIEHYIESEGSNGRLELSRTRKAWAAELGLTHEALYRALAGLQRSGRIATVEKDGVLVLSMKRDASHR